MNYLITVLKADSTDFLNAIKVNSFIDKVKEQARTFTEYTYEVEFNDNQGLYILGKHFSKALRVQQIKDYINQVEGQHDIRLHVNTNQWNPINLVLPTCDSTVQARINIVNAAYLPILKCYTDAAGTFYEVFDNNGRIAVKYGFNGNIKKDALEEHAMDEHGARGLRFNPEKYK